jgi:hypothetical protein
MTETEVKSEVIETKEVPLAEPTPEEKALQPYIRKGLTVQEAGQLQKWIEEGKPGLMRQKAESLGRIYALGYTCQELHKWFPHIPLEIFLWSRVQYNWDDSRERYRITMQGRALEAALSSRQESVRLLADAVAVTNMAWRKQLMEYLGDPENAKRPDFLPDTLAGYHKLIQLMDEMAFPTTKPGSAPPPQALGPLVNINLSAPNGTTPADVAKTLIAEMQQGKKA